MNQPHVNMSAVQTTTGRWALQDLRGRSFLLFYEGRCGGLQSQVHDLICFITFRFSTRPESKYPNICPNMSKHVQTSSFSLRFCWAEWLFGHVSHVFPYRTTAVARHQPNFDPDSNSSHASRGLFAGRQLLSSPRLRLMARMEFLGSWHLTISIH